MAEIITVRITMQYLVIATTKTVRSVRSIHCMPPFPSTDQVHIPFPEERPRASALAAHTVPRAGIFIAVLSNSHPSAGLAGFVPCGHSASGMLSSIVQGTGGILRDHFRPCLSKSVQRVFTLCKISVYTNEVDNYICVRLVAYHAILFLSSHSVDKFENSWYTAFKQWRFAKKCPLPKMGLRISQLLRPARN